jgi:Domain of unknown function (DUF4432)
MSIRIDLQRRMFGEKERPVAEGAGLSITTFRYDSGIEALRLRNRRGECVILPYKGQQIWSAAFDGRDIGMRSMFTEPVETEDYLRTYGAFLIHCGVTAMGPPGPGDDHPLHGELPNAPYQHAWLLLDEAAETATISGSYQHTVAFKVNHRATASVTLQADSAMLDIALDVENLKRTPMELMYLAHVNFRPVDDAELIASAVCSPDTVRVRRSIPSHITPPPGYTDFIAELAENPSLHTILRPSLAFDPEVVFAIDMLADAQGWVHTLQRHPGGQGDYITYRRAEAPHTIRWICRTPDQDAIGIAFPATAGVEGYRAEKQKGNIVSVEGGGRWAIAMKAGAVAKAEADTIAARIGEIVAEGAGERV